MRTEEIVSPMLAPESVLGILSCAVGIAAVVFRANIANIIVWEQNRFWGFRLGKQGITISEVVLVVWGIAFAVFGVLMLLGVVKLK